MHTDAADLLRVGEAHVLPGAPAISGFVHAVAMRRISANAAFTHSRIDDAWIGFSHGNRADRTGLYLAVGD